MIDKLLEAIDKESLLTGMSAYEESRLKELINSYLGVTVEQLEEAFHLALEDPKRENRLVLNWQAMVEKLNWRGRNE